MVAVFRSYKAILRDDTDLTSSDHLSHPRPLVQVRVVGVAVGGALRANALCKGIFVVDDYAPGVLQVGWSGTKKTLLQ